MIINTKSWHYRLISAYRDPYDYRPSTLCGYGVRVLTSPVYIFGKLCDRNLCQIGEFGSLFGHLTLIGTFLLVISNQIPNLNLAIFPFMLGVSAWLAIPTILTFFAFGFIVTRLLSFLWHPFFWLSHKLRSSLSCPTVEYQDPS